MGMSRAWRFARDTYRVWRDHLASHWAAAVAYHTLFSLAPVVIVAVAVAGLTFGRDAARREVLAQAARLWGEEGAQALKGLLEGFNHPGQTTLAVVIGGVVLLWGASNVFLSMRDSLDFLWGLRRRASAGFSGFFLERLAPVALVLGAGFVLLVSLLLSAALESVRRSLSAFTKLPGAVFPLLDAALSFLVVGLLFSLIFKVLPSGKPAWRDATVGGTLSALIFIAGKSLMGLYLGRTGATTVYGAAGSVVLLLIWINFSAQALFIGASAIKALGRAPRPGPLAAAWEEVPL
jgi:membrane protein